MTDVLTGFFAPWLVYAAISGLHLALSARRVEGYARDEQSGAPLRYRLNGPLCSQSALNLLSFAAHHFLAYPDDPSPGVLLSVARFSWFVCDYLLFERVHLYTYDLVAERLGFKLVRGCLAWYPYFYAVGLWSVADLPNPQPPTWLLAVSALIFFAGWSLARGANMQKFAFKRDPEHVFLGRIPAKTLSDGKHSVLCSGFWGVSRHVNYLGEFLMACGLALSLG